MKSSLGRHGTLCQMMAFLIVFAISAPVAARVKKHDRTGAQVVGHIQFKDKALVDMALTTGSGRLYLYVQHSKDEGVSILDVTDLSQPTVLETTFWPEGENLGQFTFLGDYAVGEVLPCSCSPLAPERRVVQDRSRPGDAWARLGFTCVKRAIVDEGGLVYVLSDTGLWIVKISPGKQQ